MCSKPNISISIISLISQTKTSTTDFHRYCYWPCHVHCCTLGDGLEANVESFPIPGGTHLTIQQKQSSLSGPAGTRMSLRDLGKSHFCNKLKIVSGHTGRHCIPFDVQTHKRLQLSSEYSSPILTGSPDFLMQPKHALEMSIPYLTKTVIIKLLVVSSTNRP